MHFPAERWNLAMEPLTAGPAGTAGVRAPHLLEFAGHDLTELSGTAIDPAGLGGAESTRGGARPDTISERPNERTPLDAPPPLPGAPGTADGSSGSTFVPFVALLVLLALAVPAIQRRLGEAADFRAPTPFVCALERPG
jgi:hypothetical protein